MLKRALDVVSSVAGLIVLSPFFILATVLIKLSSPGPIIYKSIRVGKNGQRFEMLKFRTMIVDADKRGSLVTSGDDWRITRLGRILRRSKLDELPSLWNVLIGDMSMVGPRPENPKSAALYNEEQRRVWKVRPGITSLASVKYRNEERLLAGAENLESRYFEIMQDKLQLEMEYVDRQSLKLDMLILFRTLLAIFDPKVPNA